MNVVGFDDGPFAREHRGDVLLVGAVCAGTRLDGVLTGRVRRDGRNATDVMARLVAESPFRGHIRAVLLQGIAVAGFNVVDVHRLSETLRLPVLVVARKKPSLSTIREALFGPDPSHPRVRGAAAKWALIERAGPMERLEIAQRAPARPRSTITGGQERNRRQRPTQTGLKAGAQRLWVQRVGLSEEAARQLVAATTLHGHLPEPLRLAHLIAGGVVTGQSRGRA